MNMRKKLKKILAVITFITFITVLSVSFTDSLFNGLADYDGEEVYIMTADQDSDPRGRAMPGAFINCESVSPGFASPLINNKGMSGLNSYIHLHGTNESDSYKTTMPGEQGAIIFAFPRVEALGYMYIWNYNAAGQSGNGMKNIKIQYSTDKQNWYNLKDGNFELAKAVQEENDQHGGNSSNNLNDGHRTPVNFGGLSVRYVRIVPVTNYGGNAYGLSEVRFFRFKTRPDKGSLLAATARAPGVDETDFNANNLTNNYGLSDLFSSSAMHSRQNSTMWLSEKDSDDSFVVINLDGNYPVGKMGIWNYNETDRTNSGMQNITIRYTVKEPYQNNEDGINYQNTRDWITLGDFTIPEAGSAGIPGKCDLIIDFAGARAQHIKIIPKNTDGNYGGDGFGLSAVRVFTDENPTESWASEPSRDWSAMFSNEGSFDYQTSGTGKRAREGWLQADGIYTLNTNGAKRPGLSDDSTKTLFVFSDTLTGNLDNFSGNYGQYGLNIRNRGFKNHSFATLTGNKPDPRNLQFYLNTSESTDSIMGNGDWAQELLRVGDKIYAWSFSTTNWTANQFKLNTFNTTLSGFPDFSAKPPQKNVDLIREFTEDGRDYRIEFTNAFLDCSEQGGGLPLGLHPDHEGYIYAYGLKSYRGFLLYKFPVVARFKPEALEDISKWRFFDGTDWVEDMTKCAGIEDAEDGMVSSEYSVTYMEEGPFAGKYVMTFTEFTMSTQISIATSDTPWGPFSNKHDKKIVYYCPDIISIREANQDRDVYAYNAKAHPHLSAKDELLVSYNLNSMRFDDRVSFESIHPEFITIFTIKDHAETINPPEVFLPDPNTGSKTFILDYSPLIDVIDIINTAGIFTEEKYTLRSWISFQSELTAAKTLLKSSVATQAFIDTTAARLRQAMTALIERVIENANGWTKEDGKEFYFINNILQRNVWTDGEREVYRTDSDGAKITGTKWITVDRSQYYLMNGILQINKLIASGNKFYYVERNGARAEGTRWLTVDGKQYRLENGIIQTNKFIKVDRKLYYVDKNGIQASGTKWITVAGKQYRLINGAVQTGRFIKAGGRRYYLDKNGARAEGTKWISVNRKRYRIVRSVVQTNRFITVNKRRYYVDKTGIMRINTWIRHNKKWYRTNRKGVLITNRIVKINGKKYKFDKNGKSNR